MVKKEIKYKIPLSFSVCCCENEKIWFVTNYTCMLCEYDTHLKRLRLLCCLSEDKRVQHLIGAMIKYEDKIIMAPHQGNQFIVYNVRTGSIKSYMCELDCSLKFVSVIRYGEKVYFIGGEPVVVEFCIETEQWVYHRLDVNTSKVVCNTVWGRGTVQVVDGCIYIPQSDSNYIVKLNLETFESMYIYIENEMEGYNHTYVHDNYLYTFPRYGGKVVRINLKNKLEVEVIESNLLINQSMHYVGTEDGIYFYNGKTGDIGCLGYDNRIEKIYVSPRSEKNYNAYRSCIVNRRILIARENGKFLEYLLNKKEMREVSVRLSVDEFEKYFNYLMKQKVLQEESLFLKDYLNKIEVYNRLHDDGLKKTSGEKIYELTSN